MVFLISCFFGSKVQQTFIGNWQEQSFDFTESINFQDENDLLGRITLEKWCCNYNFDYYQWLRKSENLQETFSVLKKIGLERVLSKANYNEVLFLDDYRDYDWEGDSLNSIVRKMIRSYGVVGDTANYYHKFWQRRLAEGNQETVNNILIEVDQYYNEKINKEVDIQINNEVLYDLINLNVELNECDSIQRATATLKYFDYLCAQGMEHSAYNLVFELRSIEGLNLNKDSLLQCLRYDTIPEELYWNIRNDAQWVLSYRDNGP